MTTSWRGAKKQPIHRQSLAPNLGSKLLPAVLDRIRARLCLQREPLARTGESGWGRTGPDSLKEFQDVIWINSYNGQRPYPICIAMHPAVAQVSY